MLTIKKMITNIEAQENLRHSYNKKVCIYKRLNLFESFQSKPCTKYHYYSKNTNLQADLCLSEVLCS